MKKKLACFLVAMFVVTINNNLFAQNKELKVNEIPQDVKDVLDEYLKILSEAKTLDEAGLNIVKVCAGHLVNSSGVISSDIKPYSLKKDWENVKFYKVPAVITRCVYSPNDYDGFQETLFEGDKYKIWIAKKDGTAGMPAPIPIIKPKTGKPKVISNIGSL